MVVVCADSAGFPNFPGFSLLLSFLLMCSSSHFFTFCSSWVPRRIQKRVVTFNVVFVDVTIIVLTISSDMFDLILVRNPMFVKSVIRDSLVRKIHLQQLHSGISHVWASLADSLGIFWNAMPPAIHQTGIARESETPSFLDRVVSHKHVKFVLLPS